MSFFLNPLLNISRASGDLRRGLPVNIDQYAIACAETLGEEDFQRFPGRALVVPECIKIKDQAKESKFLFYDISGFSLKKALELLLSNDFSEFPLLLEKDFDYKSVDAAIKIIKRSELLPFALISKEKINEAISLNSEDVNECIEEIDNNLYKTAEANLSLKDAKEAKILSFRSKFIAQDHYAIVIGDISKSHTPYVRIHSSCYTGDLMASLSCDCRDQLLDTVKFMSQKKENAGVILYLMQEGRGIGLVNKIRAYHLQQQGYDTIEANNLLGFEGDERVFDSACKMLESMNISNIKLLTNNPIKVQSLENKGIKISKTISLYGNINKYNESYLATKKNKMGHNL